MHFPQKIQGLALGKKSVCVRECVRVRGCVCIEELIEGPLTGWAKWFRILLHITRSPSEGNPWVDRAERFQRHYAHLFVAKGVIYPHEGLNQFVDFTVCQGSWQTTHHYFIHWPHQHFTKSNRWCVRAANPQRYLRCCGNIWLKMCPFVILIFYMFWKALCHSCCESAISINMYCKNETGNIHGLSSNTGARPDRE